MTTKYYPTFLYKEYDEKMLEILNKMNKKGYSLSNIGFLMKFVKSNNPIKYQIDYTKRNEELDIVYKQIGYQYVGSYANRHIYASNNLNADDLYSDYESYKANQLKYYSLGPLVLSVLIILAAFFFIKSLLSFVLSSIGSVLVNLEAALSLTYCFIIIILTIYYLFLFYIKHLSVQKDNFSYTKFKKYDSIYYYLFIIFTFGYVLTCLYCKVNPSALFTFLIMSIPFGFTNYMGEHKLPRTASTKKRIFYTMICLFCYFVLYAGARSFASSISNSSNKDTTNRFVEISTYDYGRFYDCKDENIANKIYDYLIPEHSKIAKIDSSFESCTLSPAWVEYNGEKLYVSDYQRFIIKEKTLIVESTVIENFDEDLALLEKLILKEK